MFNCQKDGIFKTGRILIIISIFRINFFKRGTKDFVFKYTLLLIYTKRFLCNRKWRTIQNPSDYFISFLIYRVPRRKWQPTPVFLPGESHGRRSLVGYSPPGRKELDMTERLHFHFLLSCTGEGNDSPLQCSCLENPKDGGAWWAAVYGVAQSQTRLKWLSSSSRCH